MSVPRSAVVLRHVAFEDLGLLAPILNAAGWSPSYCEAPTENLADPSIERADLLIVLGPIGVYETEAYPFLRRENAWHLPRRPAHGKGARHPRVCGTDERDRLGAPSADRGRPGILSQTARGRRCDGAALARRHVRPCDRTHTARLQRELRKPGLRVRFGRPDAAVPRRSRSATVGEWYVSHAVELSVAGVSLHELRAATADVAGRLQTRAHRIFCR